MTSFDKQEIQRTYGRIAKRYDAFAKSLGLIGFQEAAYRERAVAALQLKTGATVVEIGCGTGMNLASFQRYIGPDGKVIGVDLSEAMLEEAQKKVAQAGWNNIEFVHEDASEYRFPQGVDAILSTFSLVFVPEFETLIRNGSRALARGGRFVILDQKIPSGRMKLFIPVFELLAKPFAVTAEMSDRRPWETVAEYLDVLSFQEFYQGFCYMVVGEKKP